ncbi:MAG: FG-GAP repeat protein [Deltaproteobacteria bacterium]|nr:FG-GAP repeat protein [Deltaproteobacteria bacterium]
MRVGAPAAFIALALVGCEGAPRPKAAPDTGAPADGSEGSDTQAPVDADGDGVPAPLDCDDEAPEVYPAAPEVCGDWVPNDCARVEAGWTRELCQRVTTPILRLKRSGDSLGEVAALGDLRGDGTFTLGVGSPGISECVEVGVDALGEPIYDCGSIGGIFLLEPATLLREVGDEVRFPSWDSWGVGQRSIGGHRSPRHYGSSLEGLGDFDGDGFDDFIVGNDQQGAEEVDEVWLFWGPGPSARIDEGVQLFVGEDWERCAGYDMERAGDLTGDAVDDLLISDPCADEVWVYSGAEVRAATGPDLAPVAVVAERATPGIHFGLGVNGTRDLTGDGLADLAASAPHPEASARVADLDYVGVYEGPLSGVRDASEAVFTMRSALVRADGSIHNSGYTLDVGDLNGDGHGDLVIGDPKWNPHGDDNGAYATFVFFGPLGGDRLDSDAGAQVQYFTGSDVQAHTDFDGDGRDDLLVGSGIYPREVAFSTFMGGIGEAYLMYSPFQGSIRANADGDVVFSCDADWSACGNLGMQVQAIPDQSGDGVPDVLVADYGNEYWIFPVPLPIR